MAVAKDPGHPSLSTGTVAWRRGEARRGAAAQLGAARCGAGVEPQQYSRLSPSCGAMSTSILFLSGFTRLSNGLPVRGGGSRTEGKRKEPGIGHEYSQFDLPQH